MPILTNNSYKQIRLSELLLPPTMPGMVLFLYMTTQYLLIGALAAINLAAFIVMLNDKRKSMRTDNPERIPEGILFFLAAAFGSIGIYTAMYLLRHKTRKWYFVVGVPLLIIQNFTTLYLIRSLVL